MTYCNHANQAQYPFTLPQLPFAKEAFAPYFSPETFDYHHGKHHQAYVTNLNNLLKEDQQFAGMDLEEIITSSQHNHPAIFNNAAQVWNHSFFWHSITPNGGGIAEDNAMQQQIEQDFGNYQAFAEEFKKCAVSQFGSGWAWLVYGNHKLQIVKTNNAETPITQNMMPIIACDVWEHAYYIDYRNKRPDYVNIFVDHLINWQFAAQRLQQAKK
jgi:Fe-Mn family superoxide dismutase